MISKEITMNGWRMKNNNFTAFKASIGQRNPERNLGYEVNERSNAIRTFQNEATNPK